MPYRSSRGSTTLRTPPCSTSSPSSTPSGSSPTSGPCSPGTGTPTDEECLYVRTPEWAGGQTPAGKDNHKWWGAHNGFMKWGSLWTAMTGMDFRQISHELIQVPSGATLLTWNVEKQKDWSDPEVSENSSSTLIGSWSSGYFSCHKEVITMTTNLFNVKKTSVQWSSIDSLQRKSVRLPSKLCC